MRGSIKAHCLQCLQKHPVLILLLIQSLFLWSPSYILPGSFAKLVCPCSSISNHFSHVQTQTSFISSSQMTSAISVCCSPTPIFSCQFLLRLFICSSSFQLQAKASTSVFVSNHIRGFILIFLILS